MKHLIRWLLCFLSLSCLFTLSAPAKNQQLSVASAPVEVVLEGLRDPAFLAIDADDVLYLSEEQTGRVLQLFPDGRVLSLTEGLKMPQGLAIGDNGTLYIAAEELKGAKAKGLVLKRDPDGHLLVVASGFRKPRGLAIDQQGNLYLSTEGLLAEPGKGDEAGTIFQIDPLGRVSQVGSGFKNPQGLVVDTEENVLVAVERLQGEGEVYGGSVSHINLKDGQITPLVGPGFKDAHCLALDRLDALFFSAKQPDQQATVTEQGLLAKRTPDANLATFAAPLNHPAGLVFDSHGNLYVAERGQGRLLRFRAPLPPQVDALPAFTNQNPITVTGSTEPDALITLLGAAQPTTVMADSVGRFTAQVALAPNAPNSLDLFATSAKGQGLTAAPTTAAVVHDAVPPSVRLVSPSDGATVTGTFIVEVEATDALAGIGGVGLLVDGRLIAVTNVPPYRFSLDAKDYTGGRHILTVQATDRAGNLAAVSVTIIVLTLRITITAPADAALVPTPIVLVQGSIESSAPEVGVLVNGVAAQVDGLKFAVVVPLAPGSNPINAVAAEPSGNTATAAIAVTVPPGAEPHVMLSALPAGGIAPLTVVFSAFNLLSAQTAQVELDVDGDGAIEFTGSSLEGQVFTYSKPGLYLPTVTVTDAQGNRFTAGTIVQAYDRDQINALLQGKWTALKENLGRGDINQALESIAITEREGYLRLLSALGPQLSGIDTILTNISFVSLDADRAEYQMIRVDNGVRLSHFVLFVKDVDGIWRLKFF
ncbi:MAG: hypothetical protein HYY11_02555 [Candidatus Methylomirabilis oxyfera]|nr:hypothetical protein [Candidatus Methylomirabilis oxyfera]